MNSPESIDGIAGHLSIHYVRMYLLMTNFVINNRLP